MRKMTCNSRHPLCFWWTFSKVRSVATSQVRIWRPHVRAGRHSRKSAVFIYWSLLCVCRSLLDIHCSLLTLYPNCQTFSKVSLLLNVLYEMTKELSFENFCKPTFCVPLQMSCTCNTRTLTATCIYLLQHAHTYCNLHTLTATPLHFLQHAYTYCNTHTLTATRIRLLQHAYTYCNTHTLTATRIRLVPYCITHTLTATRIHWLQHAYTHYNVHTLTATHIHLPQHAYTYYNTHTLTATHIHWL